MTMDKAKLIEKINKLLALSNSPNEDEAKLAATKAQELIAKYNIDMETSEATKDSINYRLVDVAIDDTWKFSLSKIIADNFRCETFWYGQYKCAFYGYEMDTLAAGKTYMYLVDTLKELTEINCTKKTYTSYVMGFLVGLYDVLHKQAEGLMIITPQEVKDSYHKMSEDFKSKPTKMANVNNDYDGETFADGYDKGYHSLEKRTLTCSSC